MCTFCPCVPYEYEFTYEVITKEMNSFAYTLTLLRSRFKNHENGNPKLTYLQLNIILEIYHRSWYTYIQIIFQLYIRLFDTIFEK